MLLYYYIYIYTYICLCLVYILVGGMMSVFLMGCYNPTNKLWCTVTKVSGGHDDDTLKRLQTQLKMTKVNKVL